MRWTVDTTSEFEKTFEKNHPDKTDALETVIEKLERYPERYGKPLGGRLHGIWQIKLGNAFRIWYEIDKENNHVTLKSVLHKDEARRRY